MAKPLPGGSQDPPRPLRREEKVRYKSWFPRLEVNRSRVTAEATRRYNCISWTTGNTQSWDWPPAMYPEVSEREAFALYYKHRGFTPISAEQAAQIGRDLLVVAYWEDSEQPTHGSVRGPGHLDRWESKCGSAARLTHDRDELQSKLYGSIRGYYLGGAPAEQPPPSPPAADLGDRLQNKLEQRLSALPASLVQEFEEAYADWDRFRESAQVAVHSNPAKYCQGEAFGRLAELGPDCLPLLMEKIRDGDFFCRYLAEKISLQGDRSLPVLSPQQPRCSEQEKARQVMEQWLDSRW